MQLIVQECFHGLAKNRMLKKLLGSSNGSVYCISALVNERERNPLTSCGVVYVLRKGLRALRCRANSGSKLGLVRSAKMARGDAL